MFCQSLQGFINRRRVMGKITDVNALRTAGNNFLTPLHPGK